MAFPRLRLVAAVLLCFANLIVSAAATNRRTSHPTKPVTPAASGPVTFTPAEVEAGSPELIRVSAPDAVSVDGEWFGHKLQFFQGKSSKGWYALAGSDVEAATVPTTLRITEQLADGTKKDLSTNVPIHAAHYRTSSISVAPKFVEPGPDDRPLIEAASKAKQKAFDLELKSGKPLWSGSFIAPVKAAATDSFGTRRMFNGKLASIHKGTDFRAPSGTPVLAGNSGVVLLAQPLYFEGNCIMIDHGQGLISISMHLSRIDVKPGDKVTKGQQVGLSGATGRVTGPHLHWAIRWQGSMLDPAKLLKLNLSGLP